MTIKWETAITIHKQWHEKEHTPSGVTPNPFHFIHSKEFTAQLSNLSTVIFFLGRGKTFILVALLQFQEVVLIPQVAGIETITNLEGIFLRRQGLLGWKAPLVLSELPVSLRWLSLPRWRKKK